MLGCADKMVMAPYEKGDHVKVEFLDEETGDSEWMWVIVERSDEENAILFGKLDSQPVVHTRGLALGQELAVAFDRIREHRKPSSF